MYPRNEAKKPIAHTTTMPTLTLMFAAGFTAARVWPPTIDDMREKPVKVAALNSSGIVTKYNLSADLSLMPAP